MFWFNSYSVDFINSKIWTTCLCLGSWTKRRSGGKKRRKKKNMSVKARKIISNTNSCLFSLCSLHLSLGSAKWIHKSSSSATNVKTSPKQKLSTVTIFLHCQQVLILLISQQKWWKDSYKITGPQDGRDLKTIWFYPSVTWGCTRLWKRKQLSFKDTEHWRQNRDKNLDFLIPSPVKSPCCISK